MKINDELKFIDDKLIDKLNRLAKSEIEYWDLRCGSITGTLLSFTDKKSKEISSYMLSECGIRAFLNGGVGFVVLKDLSKESIRNGFLKSIKLAKLSESLNQNKFKIKIQDPYIRSFKISARKKIEDVDVEEKIEIVKDHEEIASSFSPKVKNTRTLYADRLISTVFINSIGSSIHQEYSIVRLFSLVFAQQNGIIQRAMNTVGGLGGFEIAQTEKALNLSRKSSLEAVELLSAKSPVGGNFTIIMDPKLCGTFIHEALGHAVEADIVLNKESVLEGKIGEQIALEDVNVVDDPTMGQGKKYNLPYELFGSYFVDSEGIPSSSTVIIENGILKNYMHSLETSSRMGVAPNGHGRASSNTSLPQVRMGFTYLEPKDWDLDEMIEDTKKGILCEDFQYGYCDTPSGNFTFRVKLSHMIEKGEKKEIMRDVSLSGMTLEVLNNITAIGDKKSFGFSSGLCGKSGQSVRVCDGGPYIRIENFTVGGLN